MGNTIEGNGKMSVQRYLDHESTVSDDYRVESMVLIGPYPSTGFFTGDGGFFASQRTKAARVTLVADDGWPVTRLEEVRKLFQKPYSRRKVRVLRASEGANLVHVKAYYIVWKHRKAKTRRRTLLLGSANASSQGFGQHSESFVAINLSAVKDADQRAAVRNYFESIQAIGGEQADEDKIIASIWFWIGNGELSWASLPRLSVRPFEGDLTPRAFDAWVRRGTLCHKYQPDSLFGKIRLQLEKPLPPGEFEPLLQESGFAMEGNRKSIVTTYGATSDDGVETDSVAKKPAWLRSLFVETLYGYWTSEKCQSSLESRFRAKGHSKRARRIESIRKGGETPSTVEAWVKSSVEAASSLRNKIAEKYGPDAADRYFAKEGTVDEWLPSFQEAAQRKVERDSRRARDPEFIKRYVSGYELVPVPRMGEDIIRLVESLCETLALKLSGASLQNQLAATLRTECGSSVEGIDAKDLANLIEQRWKENPAFRAQLCAFHEAWGRKT